MKKEEITTASELVSRIDQIKTQIGLWAKVVDKHDMTLGHKWHLFAMHMVPDAAFDKLKADCVKELERMLADYEKQLEDM